MEKIEIPVAFTDGEAMRAMGLPEDMLGEMLPMIQKSRETARPKAAFRQAAISEVDGEGATVGGVRMKSRILAVNLKDRATAVPYVCTCGTELEALARAASDPMDSYFQYALNEMVLRLAIDVLRDTVSTRFSIKPIYAMSPGSLADWPLPAQGPLFQALGDVEQGIGVELTDSFLMVPIKSVSGIFFTAEEEYVNCMLCPREDCTGRRAPYDTGLFERRFASSMN